jgi:hypothetical protein
MLRAALGIRVHSGWGALIAVSHGNGTIEILDRRRIPITGTTDAGASQPYHAARNLQLPEAELFLANAFTAAHTTASRALRQLMDDLHAQKYRVTGCAILMSAARPLPPLEKILAAHPLLHTAEGQFFRDAFAKACESNALPVTKIRERDLDLALTEKFARATTRIKKQIDLAARPLGPPWTTDQKLATLAALLSLKSSPTEKPRVRKT